mgnify:CR=1 FL=1
MSKVRSKSRYLFLPTRARILDNERRLYILMFKSWLRNKDGSLRNEEGSKIDGCCDKYYFSFSFSLFLHEILELKKVEGSASKAKNDFQILFFEVHATTNGSRVFSLVFECSRQVPKCLITIISTVV